MACAAPDPSAPAPHPAPSSASTDPPVTPWAAPAVRLEPVDPRARVDPVRCLAEDGDPPDPYARLAFRWWINDDPFPPPAGSSVSDLLPAAEVPLRSVVRCEARWEGPDATSPWSAPATASSRPAGGNLLVVILDDLGTDKWSSYGEHPLPPPTPNLTALAEESLRFTAFYATPVCSPTRAALLTGRTASRTGLGALPDPGFQLDPDEAGLPEVLAHSPLGPYASGLAGKWHLAGVEVADAPQHPATLGFQRFQGSLNNLAVRLLPDSELPGDYFQYERNDQGKLRWVEGYATVDTTDAALAMAQTLPEPWLLVVAYNAPHIPLHWPPAELHGYDAATASESLMFPAMVEALDNEFGRLWAGLAPWRDDLVTLVLSDNGTASDQVLPPADPNRAKGTLFQGGVRVPLVVHAPWVAPGLTPVPAQVTDLLPTLAEVAGVDLTRVIDPRTGSPVVLDGRSLLPWFTEPERAPLDRALVLEHFLPNGPGPHLFLQRAILADGYKLVRQDFLDEGALRLEMLYATTPDAAYDGPDLLVPPRAPEHEARRTELGALLDAWVAQLDLPP